MNGLYSDEAKGTAILFYNGEISEIAYFHKRARRKKVFENFNKKIAALKQPHLNQILIIYDKETQQAAVDRLDKRIPGRNKNNYRGLQVRQNIPRMGKKNNE